jgi:Tfp pilus assembly protein FimV
MTMSDREGLITRIRQVRRLATARDRPSSDATGPQPERLQALEARVAHLEQQLEGLQDAVHRESERQAKLIAELQTQVQPGAMGAALAEDVRNRGL